MRFVPLVPLAQDPGPWRVFGNLELAWSGADPAPWTRAVRAGLAVHAVHLEHPVGEDRLLEEAVRVLGAGLECDFLVAPAKPPSTRWGASRFLGGVEALLEAATGRGVKVVLRPVAGATPRLLELLREARGDGVGFCWDAALGEDPEPVADRLHCAVGGSDSDPRPLQVLGYRWNLAVPATDPEAVRPVLARLASAFPPVLFPAELPATALGRPVVPDPEVTLGRTWDRP